MMQRSAWWKLCGEDISMHGSRKTFHQSMLVGERWGLRGQGRTEHLERKNSRKEEPGDRREDQPCHSPEDFMQ